MPPAPDALGDRHRRLPVAGAARAARCRGSRPTSRSTGHQVVVWIGNTLGGAPLDDWSVRTFAAWKVGRKGKDDGLVMFIFAADRKIDIEVGYGLEGQVPDAIANRVIQEVMAPRLRAGDRDGAVQAGVDAILTAIEGKPFQALETSARQPAQASLPRRARAADLPRDGGRAFLVLLMFNPRLAMLLLWSVARAAAAASRRRRWPRRRRLPRRWRPLRRRRRARRMVTRCGGYTKRFARRIDRERIKRAIQHAERKTSGEIVVSVAPFFLGSVQRAADRAFVRLGVSRTRERNGVLIFVVPSRRSFVILGDRASTSASVRSSGSRGARPSRSASRAAT